MYRLLSFKNDLVSLIYIFYVGVKMPKSYIYRFIFFLMNTFRSHNKLFLYKLNTQKKWKTITLLHVHIIHLGRNHPTRTHSARTSIRYKTTQCENMIGAKPPRFVTRLAVNFSHFHLLLLNHRANY